MTTDELKALDGPYILAAEHERIVAEARNSALEEAASMLLRKFSSMGLIEDFAAAIRALKKK